MVRLVGGEGRRLVPVATLCVVDGGGRGKVKMTAFAEVREELL